MHPPHHSIEAMADLQGVSLRGKQIGEDFDEVVAAQDRELAQRLEKVEAEESAGSMRKSRILQPGAPPTGMFFGLSDEGGDDLSFSEEHWSDSEYDGIVQNTRSSQGLVLHVSQMLIKSSSGEVWYTHSRLLPFEMRTARKVSLSLSFSISCFISSLFSLRRLSV
jgi:hypothetical protein